MCVEKKIEEIEATLKLKANADQCYSRDEVNDQLELKADKAGYDESTEVDRKLGLKADSAEHYTKTQVDEKLGLKADKADHDTRAHRVDAKLERYEQTRNDLALWRPVVDARLQAVVGNNGGRVVGGAAPIAGDERDELGMRYQRLEELLSGEAHATDRLLANLRYYCVLMAKHYKSAHEHVMTEITTQDGWRMAANFAVGTIKLAFASVFTGITSGTAAWLFPMLVEKRRELSDDLFLGEELGDFSYAIDAPTGSLIVPSRVEYQRKKIEEIAQDVDGSAKAEPVQDGYQESFKAGLDGIAQTVAGQMISVFEPVGSRELKDPESFILEKEEQVAKFEAELRQVPTEADRKVVKKEFLDSLREDIGDHKDGIWHWFTRPLPRTEFKERWDELSSLLEVQMKRMCWRLWCRSQWRNKWDRYKREVNSNLTNNLPHAPEEWPHEVWGDMTNLKPQQWDTICHDFIGPEHDPAHPVTLRLGGKKITDAKNRQDCKAWISMATVQCCQIKRDANHFRNWYVDLDRLARITPSLLEKRVVAPTAYAMIKSNDDNVKAVLARVRTRGRNIGITKITFEKDSEEWEMLSPSDRCFPKKGCKMKVTCASDGRVWGAKFAVELVGTGYTGGATFRMFKSDTVSLKNGNEANVDVTGLQEIRLRDRSEHRSRTDTTPWKFDIIGDALRGVPKPTVTSVEWVVVDQRIKVTGNFEPPAQPAQAQPALESGDWIHVLQNDKVVGGSKLGPPPKEGEQRKWTVETKEIDPELEITVRLTVKRPGHEISSSDSAPHVSTPPAENPAANPPNGQA